MTGFPARAPKRATLLLIIIGVLAGALAGEVALRVYAAVDDQIGRELRSFDLLAALIEPHGTLGYRQKPHSTYRYPNGTVATSNEEGYRGPLVEVPKPDGTFRIVLLGGSATHGWGVSDHQTIDAHLRRLLAQRLPQRRTEVVNLAFDGYDSYQVFERLRSDGLPRAPDLIIVNSGINDVRNARFPNLQDKDPRTMLWTATLRRLRAATARGGPTLYTHLKHYSYLARLPGLIRQRVRHAKERVESESGPIEPNLEAAEYFVRNLRRIVDPAVARDIPVILSTPPSALPVLFPPDATSALSYWINDAATTQRLRDILATQMERFAAEQARHGRRVVYTAHDLRNPALFLDDCHLTSQGNRRLALELFDVVAPFLTSHAFSPSTGH